MGSGRRRRSLGAASVQRIAGKRGKGPEQVWMEETVIPALRQIGYLVYHTWNSQNSEKGFPDLACIPPEGRPDWPVLMLELKVNDNVMTVEQWLWIRALHEKTIFASEARPETFHDLLRQATNGDLT